LNVDHSDSAALVFQQIPGGTHRSTQAGICARLLHRPCVQYTSEQLARCAGEHNLVRSVGRTAVCWDNALAESFWAKMKVEFYEMVDQLARLGIQLLFTIGGDGTLRGAHSIVAEVRRRGLKIAVVGVPKTIDNDISFIDTSFGFETAVEAARQATRAAYVEPSCHRSGIGLVKLMGRDSGFIASFATLADTQVGICLIPEIAFSIDGVVEAARQRIERDGYVVIVVAEGAGQDLLDVAGERDASGNRRHGDIGALLRDQIGEAFRAQGTTANIKYIDPSYMIRSLPANARDANLCLRLGHAAVHAGMAGKTDVVIGSWRRRLTHVPIPLAVSSRKKVDTDSYLWQTVLSVTGQDDNLLNVGVGAS